MLSPLRRNFRSAGDLQVRKNSKTHPSTTCSFPSKYILPPGREAYVVRRQSNFSDCWSSDLPINGNRRRNMRSQENHTVFPVGERETSEAVSTVELIELIYSWGAIAWWFFVSGLVGRRWMR